MANIVFFMMLLEFGAQRDEKHPVFKVTWNKL